MSTASKENKLVPPPDMAAFLARAGENPAQVAIGVKDAPKPAQTPPVAPEPAGDSPATPPAAPAARKTAQRTAKPAQAPAAKPKPTRKAAPKVEVPPDEYRWLKPATRDIPPVFNLRPGHVYYEKLKWLGETQYGESMQSIALNAIKAEVDRRLKEAGVPEYWIHPKKD
jgi:hypothetical protein